MKIENVMTKRVVKLKPDYTMKQAAEILFRNKISGAPVVNEKDWVIGILSEKDVFRTLHPSFREFVFSEEKLSDFDDPEIGLKKLEKKTVKDCMHKDVVVARTDAEIMKIGALMLAKNYNRVPVVKHKKIVGMVSRREIYHSIFKKYFKSKK